MMIRMQLLSQLAHSIGVFGTRTPSEEIKERKGNEKTARVNRKGGKSQRGSLLSRKSFDGPRVPDWVGIVKMNRLADSNETK
jgi:hypothetical protein